MQIRKSGNGMAYLHKNGIIRGDVNPSNILVRDDGTPAICDFGNSEFADARKPLTDLVGTPRYVPPEAIEIMESFRRKSESDPDSDMPPKTYLAFSRDVWSFAMTALELMTGRVPYFQYFLNLAIFIHIVLGELPARSDYEVAPAAVWDILVRCWVRVPDRRPTIFQMKEDLNGAGIEDELTSNLESTLLRPPSAA